MRLLRHGWIALAALVFAACNSDDLGPNISGVPTLSIQDVVLTPKFDTAFFTDTATPASQVQFVATAFGRGGDAIPNVRFVWSSSDNAIATVDSTGLVTAHSRGTAVISASAGKIGKATLIAVPATNTITITPSIDTVFVDDPIAAKDTLRLVAKGFDQNGVPLTGVTFTWQSGAPTIASVSATGLVRAVSVGSTTITARAGDAVATTSLLVASVVKNVSLTSPVTQVLAGDTVQLKATAFDYSNAPITRKFVYTSSNTNVATVDTLGRAIFKTIGSATFTATTAFRSASVAAVTALDRKLLVVDAGRDVSCGFTALGRGYCWGAGLLLASAADTSCFDQQPPGSSSPCTLLPKRHDGTALQFTTISVGDNVACGLTIDRQPYCWGTNADGELGNGGKGGGATPTLATVQNHRFTAISAGGRHACALNLLGTAYCWGADESGQLGDRRFANSTTPIPVADTSLSFSMISAGGNHTCGLVFGVAFCWGADAQGQLGDGLTTAREFPAPAGTGTIFIAISAGGRHTCALSAANSVFCWGDNTNGQVGIGSPSAIVSAPTAVPGTYTAISAGDHHTCAIATTGALTCWGGSDFGQVGDGNPNPHDVPSPTVVNGGFVALSVTSGFRHSCAVRGNDGQTLCWGSNMFGALGNELQAAVRATPQLVARPR